GSGLGGVLPDRGRRDPRARRRASRGGRGGGLARRRGGAEEPGAGRGRAGAVGAEDWREAWGVNTRRDLAAAEEIEHRRRVERALDGGATIVDPATTRLGPHVTIEADAILHPFISLEGNTAVREGAQ